MLFVKSFGGAAIALPDPFIRTFISIKSFVEKMDNRIKKVRELLPEANCGSCGHTNCLIMAEALVSSAKKGTIKGLYCPIGGDQVMNRITAFLGLPVAKREPPLAIVRCNGTCEHRPRVPVFEDLPTCKAMDGSGRGDIGCSYGCLGKGDCESACRFNAIHVNPETGLSEVNESLCVGCGACVRVCPRHIIVLRKRGPGGKRIYVRCVNKDPDNLALAVCTVACTGCGNCQEACRFDAITIEDHLSVIDPDKCRLCTQCVSQCPTGALAMVNFSGLQDRTEKKEEAQTEGKR